MRGTGRPVLESAADADDADRQLVHDRAVADELVGAHRREGRDRIEERNETGFGEPGAEPHHVLLSDAHVDEATGELVGKGLERHEAEVAGQQQDAVVLLPELRQGRREGLAHQDPATSWTACAYSASDIGR